MKISPFILLAASLWFAACQIVESDIPEFTAAVLSAQIEQDENTKTVLSESNNILWSGNDQIVAFMKTSYGHKYQIQPSFVGKTYANFSKITAVNGEDLSAGMEYEHIIAYYPFNEGIECVKSGNNYTLNVILPAEQTYIAKSFGNGAWPMVAVSENSNITFKNVCGGMLLQLKGTQKVTSITVQGKNDEVLSGTATVTAYTDGETKPAITMTGTDAISKTATLYCGSEGVQLNEDNATEFIITLPPVLFSKGFTVTITDSESKTHIIETDKANTILRSSLLNMPAVKVGASEGDNGADGDRESEDGVIPVGEIHLNQTSLKLPPGFSYTFTATIFPIDATVQTLEWNSNNTSVVTIDQSGKITTKSAGKAKITAVAGDVSESCSIRVIAPTTREPIDYKVDGVSYGKGIVLGEIIWAPVNCGYEPANGEYKGYPYGKLYQWGRKYGQGYDISYDATAPEIVEGPISVVEGQKEVYSNTFFHVNESPYSWASPQNEKLWNSGTEESPKKTEYDPCPEGWRVPTWGELFNIRNGFVYKTVNGQKGCYFSGPYTYLDGVPLVFFPAGGCYKYSDNAEGRDIYGEYWCSQEGYGIGFNMNFDSYTDFWGNYQYTGCSVRCVQE